MFMVQITSNDHRHALPLCDPAWPQLPARPLQVLATITVRRCWEADHRPSPQLQGWCQLAAVRWRFLHHSIVSLTVEQQPLQRNLRLLPYLLTGLAGLALGVVAMRLWQTRIVATVPPATGEPATIAAQQPGSRQWSSFRPTSRQMLVAAGVVLLAAAAIFATRDDSSMGAGGLGGPTASEGVQASDQSLDDVDTMITRLAARLEEDPQDGEGFRMLGWSYLMTGKPREALPAFQRALALLPDDARVQSGYGETLTALADGTVTADAKAAFQRALVRDPLEPRARYFLALWQDQNGNSRQALDTLLQLANSGPADATWQAELRREITRVSGALGVDVSDRLPPLSAAEPGADLPQLDPATISAAQQLPGQDREQMIRSMVDGLAARLQANPADPGGWVRLLRSRMVLTQGDQAARDLASARRALAGNAAGLAQVNQAASQLNVPGA